MGWLCILNQSYSTTCFGFDVHGTFFTSNLCRLQHIVLCRNHFINANFFRWFSTRSELGTYAGRLILFVHAF